MIQYREWVMSEEAAHDPVDALTRRELDVLRLVATGEPSRGVAESLQLSEATVKSHLYNIYRKLRVRNRVEAANWYLNHHPLSGPVPAAEAPARGSR